MGIMVFNYYNSGFVSSNVVLRVLQGNFLKCRGDRDQMPERALEALMVVVRCSIGAPTGRTGFRVRLHKKTKRCVYKWTLYGP